VEIAPSEVITTETQAESETSRGFIDDVLEALTSDEHSFERAVALGVEWHARAGDLVGLSRELARLGGLIDGALEQRSPPTAADRRRCRAVIDEASARTFEAFASASRGRRDRWLSYYAHEMRNALNTLVNAQWILRNGEGKGSARVFDMAERAVRRIETIVKEFRDLEAQSTQSAPGRPDKA
jgi:signal transduction histidine kinase